MRALVQRVREANVSVDGEVVGSCGGGLLVLLGVGQGDDEDVAGRVWAKVRDMRIFPDAEGRTNLSLMDVGGDLLVVSQFTLYASCRKGRRPSFALAAAPDEAERLYERFCEMAEADVAHVGRGVFGAMMEVSLTNDGPFTIWVDSDELAGPRRG